MFSPPPKRIIKDIPQTRIEKRYKNILNSLIKKYKEDHPYIMQMQKERGKRRGRRGKKQDNQESDNHNNKFKKFAEDTSEISIIV